LTPDIIQDIIKCKLKSRSAKISPCLRAFAMTLHFYSAKAYNYVRRKFTNLLPHEKTLAKWYQIIDDNPGFTKQAFNSIANKVQSEAPVIINLTMDEISIREHIHWDGKEFHGYVDFGIEGNNKDEKIPKAKNAFIFMAVALNSNWKVPLGYFLINSLNASERTNLLLKCLKILHENTRNIFSNSSFSQKISMANIDAVVKYVNEFVIYIQGLTIDNGRNILHSERKVGFLGFIICLQNVTELFKLLFKKSNGKFEYLLTYKLSQDHLEVFFSALRSRGGFNNNHSAYQFRNAHSRLIVKHEISGSEAGNCMNFEGIEILHVGSHNIKCPPDTIVDEFIENDRTLDHDYLTTVWRLSPFVEDTCKYISGFVSKSVARLIYCNFCKSFLFHSEDSSLLSIIKNRDGLTIASKDVQSICHTCEFRYRTIENKLQSTDITQFRNKIFILVNTSVFTDKELFDHISNQDLFFNHRTELIRLVINKYLKIRIHYTNKQILRRILKSSLILKSMRSTVSFIITQIQYYLISGNCVSKPNIL
ncbi:THAP domain-containing protein 9, partial [Trachymyrmex cornetzi]